MFSNCNKNSTTRLWFYITVYLRWKMCYILRCPYSSQCNETLHWALQFIGAEKRNVWIVFSFNLACVRGSQHLNKKAELAFTDLVERHKELSCFNSYQHITRASTHVIAATIVIKVLHVRNASVSGAYAALNKLKWTEWEILERT